MRILTVDPGFNTGLAYWQDGELITTETLSSRGTTKHEDLYWLFLAELIRWEPDKVVVEGVAMWGNTMHSMVAAQKGDSFGLAYLVGIYWSLCITHNIDFEVISVRDWKGNMNKTITANRIEYRLGRKFSEHESDAVGIGLSIQGKL